MADGVIPGYTLLSVVEPPMTPGRRVAEKHMALKSFRAYDHESEAVREMVWDIMTSRGPQKQIYGPIPEKDR